MARARLSAPRQHGKCPAPARDAHFVNVSPAGSPPATTRFPSCSRTPPAAASPPAQGSTGESRLQVEYTDGGSRRQPCGWLPNGRVGKRIPCALGTCAERPQALCEVGEAPPGSGKVEPARTAAGLERRATE